MRDVEKQKAAIKRWREEHREQLRSYKRGYMREWRSNRLRNGTMIDYQDPQLEYELTHTVMSKDIFSYGIFKNAPRVKL